MGESGQPQAANESRGSGVSGGEAGSLAASINANPTPSSSGRGGEHAVNQTSANSGGAGNLLLRKRIREAVYERNQVVERQIRDEVRRRYQQPQAPSVGTARARHKLSSSSTSASAGGTSSASIRTSTPPLILVSGPELTGKSHVVLAALRPLVESQLHGYVVRGKCDQGGIGGSKGTGDGEHDRAWQHAVTSPYPGLATALDELVGSVLQRGPQEVDRIRSAVRQRVVGAEAFVLTRTVPSLGQLLQIPDNRAGGGVERSSRRSRQHDHDEARDANRNDDPILPPSPDADLSFGYAFENLIRAISSTVHPVVLVLDDWHACDASSLKLLASLLSRRGDDDAVSCPGFLVVGTLRPDKVAADSTLAVALREIEDSYQGTEIAHFSLHNFDKDEIGSVLSQFFRVPNNKVQSLASFVHGRTAGNPLHVAELVAHLLDQELITVESGDSGQQQQQVSGWSWDDQEIEMSVDASTSLEKLYLRRLQQLPYECQHALQVAACLGLEFDDRILEDAWDMPASKAIQQAVASEVLLASRGPGRGTTTRYRFENSHIHRAVLSLVPTERRTELHLDVGRRIWSHIDDNSTDEYLHAALSMFRIGKELIQEPREREAVASLCYRAGYASARSSSFLASSEYFGFGLDILGAAAWREHYDLALSLSNAASEMNMCAGNFGAMDGHIDSILANARIFGDSVQARATRIYSYGMRDARQSDAVQEGVDVLRHLGVKLPRRGNRLRLAFELFRVRRLLKDKTDSVLLRLPTLRDSGKRSCLQILSLVYQNALFARPDLVPFVILRMITITINHGMSEFASVAFTNFGMLCIRVLRNVDMGFRFGSLGLALLDRFKNNELVPRVYATFYKHIYVHKKPIKATLQPLAKAYRIGLYTGDLEAAFLCALYFCMNSFDAGIRLPVIEREYSDIVRRMESSRQKSMLTTALPLLRWKRDLMGLSNDPLSPDGELVNYDDLKKSAEEDGRPLLVSVVLTCQMIVAHVLNEYDFAATLLDGFVAKYLDVIPPGSSKVGATMTIGLCAVELARRGPKRRHYTRVAKSMARSLGASARQCPCNCLDKLYLLQAELASLRNDVPVANQLFLASIALSESSRSRYVCAKANEGMARHLLRLGTKDPEAYQDAHSYFLESCRVYKEWGAAIKVERLTSEVRALFPGSQEEKAGTTRPAARPSLLQGAGEGSSSTAFAPRPRLSLIRADDGSSSQDLYGP